MAGTKYKLVEQILLRLHKAGLSPHFVLIGSWAVYYYRYYFKGLDYLPFTFKVATDYCQTSCQGRSQGNHRVDR